MRRLWNGLSWLAAIALLAWAVIVFAIECGA